jgi:hypothetical protein
MVLALLWLMVAGASAEALSKCSDDEAHLKSFQIAVSPDPPIPGQKTVVEVSGTLDKVVRAGTMSLSLQVGPIKLASQVPFALNPGVPTKDIKIKIGPFTYPKLLVPFINLVEGRFSIVDEQQDMIACIGLQLPISSVADTSSTHLDPQLHEMWPSKCGDNSSDHFKNLIVAIEHIPMKGNQLMVNVAGDLDETITAGVFSANVDLVVTQLSLNIPYSVSPGLAPQHYTASVGPVDIPKTLRIPNIRGTMKAVDTNGEEIFFCSDFDIPASEALPSAVLIV